MDSASALRRLIAPVLAAAALAVAWTAMAAPNRGAGANAFDAARFLEADAGFSAGEIQRVEAGEVVARGLPVDQDSVGIVAAALLAVPAEFFLERFRRIEQFKKTAEVQQIGRLRFPPSAADLEELTLDAAELKAMHRCRPRDCDLKLDARGIERVRAAPDEAATMPALRAHLADYASRYLREGNAALIEYRDKPRPLPVGAELKQILGDSPYLQRHWPDLYAAVAAFQGTLPLGLEHFIYWSKEKVGPRAVVSLTHTIIRPPRDGIAAIATKQIYASHYTTGSMGMIILAERRGTPAPRTLVIYLNRTRVDMFDGLLGGLKRSIVRSRARSGAERMMAGMRARVEAQYRSLQ